MYQVLEGYLEAKQWQGDSIETPRWLWIKDNKTQPLASEFQIRTVLATVGFEQSLTEEQVELILKSLADAENTPENKNDNEFFYISGGKMFKLNGTGQLTATEHPAAEPVTWPLGHQVRPTQQSLGINGCTDCHKERSAFFFNTVEGVGPLKTQNVASRSMHNFVGKDKVYQKLFGLSFLMRPVFKVILFISVLIIGSILLILYFKVLGRFSGIIERRK